MLSRIPLRSLRHSSLRAVSLFEQRALLSSSIRCLQQQESSKEQTKETLETTPKKKRPLSRVAIGGTPTTNRWAPQNSEEFISWKSIVVLVVVGGVVTYFFSREKERLRTQRELEQNRPVGRPLIGGPFSLIDTNGKPFTDEDLIDPDMKRFSIIYFGFSHCPDVCPEELDKLGDMIDELKTHNVQLQPIFITCDPARDTPEVVKAYLADFHPDLIGLTGDYNEVKNACKQYRVYFSTPPNVKPGQDYLVDHSIFFYLMDPEGKFVDVIGRDMDAKGGVQKILKCADAFIPEVELEKRKAGIFGFLYK